MSIIKDWISRLLGKPPAKPRQSVLTFDKYEELTATQAIRFEHLKSTVPATSRDQLPSMPEQPWYSLDDACDRMSVSQADLLGAAAADRVQCFVYTRNAPGYWDAAPSTPVPGSVPDFLVLPASLCAEIGNQQEVKVRELVYHHSANNVLRFRLKYPETIAANLLYLQHPLPDTDTVYG
ncbi:MAG: hypothetical protein HKN35_09520 [Woeseia sp.]|nr:hypothetical protein [Woeseia sp.]MBT8097557.1 hypothetical protein [Woeseia sp.]NNE61123.1 hypothetical protein [Woeseia sp.]NNL55726.1 hypothetical protein [Woeseia sp.]